MRSVSILGDSISTYEGFHPPSYNVYYQGANLKVNGLRSEQDTWWMKVLYYLKAEVCVNNSYSGCKVTGDSFPSAGSVDRMRMLGRKDSAPEIILIYLGINDFGYGVPAKKPSILSGQENFTDSYTDMLRRMRSYHPGTSILCGTLLKGYISYKPDWKFPEDMGGGKLSDYNEGIRKAAARTGCLTADLARVGRGYDTLDGVHPNRRGHEELAGAWIRSLQALGL